MTNIAILLCTFNGARFLPAQLSSYGSQTWRDWRLFASDDGSSDQTAAILAQYQKTLGSNQVQIRSGPRRGFVTNFLSLVCDPSIDADYYAYSDQDDIWEPEKLARAIEVLQQTPPHVPMSPGTTSTA